MITLETLVQVATMLKAEPEHRERPFAEMFTPALVLLSDWSQRLAKANIRKAQIETITRYANDEMVPWAKAIKAITRVEEVNEKLLVNFRTLVRIHDSELFHPFSPAEYWLEQWEQQEALPRSFVERAAELYPGWLEAMISFERSKSRKNHLTAQKPNKAATESKRSSSRKAKTGVAKQQ